jgi:Protein of unknown function (DUF1173)
VDIQHFLVNERRYAESDPALQGALASAYEATHRPRCLCMAGGVEMYIARHRVFLVKRMPDTGHLHHAACPSFEPPAQQSGLGELLGQAVIEHAPDTIELRVDFPLDRAPGRSITKTEPQPPGEVRVPRKRMSLRALTHYLFERAGFNRWTPAMAGKRGQGVVHRYLGEAASEIRIKGLRLTDRLYVPEPFQQATQSEAGERRRHKLAFLHEDQGEQRFGMALLIGEFKTSDATASGRRLWVKHMPDVPLLMPTKAWERVERVYGALMEARNADTANPPKIVVCALIFARREHTYQVDAASFVLFHPQWIPVEGVHELPLIDALLAQQRRFVKPLRYDAQAAAAFPNALLLDAGSEPVALHIVSEFVDPKEKAAKVRVLKEADPRTWVWHTSEAMPLLPPVAAAARPSR